MNRNLEYGKQGEETAVKYLEAHGFEILETNWRVFKLEVDIIAKQESIVVFVEVKARAKGSVTLGRESVTAKKQKYLLRAANEYVLRNSISEEVRFDIVEVEGKGEVTHIKNAFSSIEYS